MSVGVIPAKSGKEKVALEFNLLPKQVQYIESTADTCIYAGGVGAAKTIADVCLAIIYALKHPGIDILILSPTYGMLRDTVIREFRNLCPQYLLKKQTWGVYPEATFYTQNKAGKNSSIRFRAFDDAGKGKGITIGLLIIDELTEVPEAVLNEVENRVRQHGMPNHKRYTTNPDSKDHYVYQRYIKPATTGAVSKDEIEYIPTTTFDNFMLPPEYLKAQERKKLTMPAAYRRDNLGEWGDFDTDTIGVFRKVKQFSTDYLVAWVDGSYSDKKKSDRTAVSVVGFVPDAQTKKDLWNIEFTGKSWEKSISDATVMRELIEFLHQYQPVETCIESQLGDSTQVFIDRLVDVEKELNLTPRNLWTWQHQGKNKHEKIMFYVAGNKERISVVDGTDTDYLYRITRYKKGIDHEDEADSLADAINLWQTSKYLLQYIKAHQQVG